VVTTHQERSNDGWICSPKFLKCEHCSQIYSKGKNAQGNLKQHLQRFHCQSVDICDSSKIIFISFLIRFMFQKETEEVLGTCSRGDPKANIACYLRDCSITYDSFKSLYTHIENNHIRDLDVTFDFHMFPSTGTPPSLSYETCSEQSRSTSIAAIALAPLDNTSSSEGSSPSELRSLSHGHSIVPDLSLFMSGSTSEPN